MTEFTLNGFIDEIQLDHSNQYQVVIDNKEPEETIRIYLFVFLFSFLKHTQSSALQGTFLQTKQIRLITAQVFVYRFELATMRFGKCLLSPSLNLHTKKT